ncbi:MAG TPA: hypothetical protein VHN98_08725, partial [Acidimicrobiales bacterium]|nr:hypothetical protein [Acidimicrobiales bacterium]
MDRGPAAPPRDDAGSTMIIAVIVMMILSTLSLAGLARALSELSFIRHGQQYDAALALADAGVADAVYKLQHGIVPSGTQTGSGLGGTWRYRVDPQSATEVYVYSVGQVGGATGAQHGVRARVTRSPMYKYALFGIQSLSLDTTQLAVDAYSFLVLGSTTDTGQALVGTNGAMTCTGGGNFGAAQYYFSSVTPPPSGCPNPVRLAQKEVFPTPVLPSGACPPNTLGAVVLTGVVDGSHGSPMVCKATGGVSSVKMTGTISVVNPPLVLYVGKGVTLDLSSAVINAGGNAANVVIQKEGTDAVTLDPAVPVLGTPAAVSFSGVLYAPQVDLRMASSKWFTGSIVANSVTVSGNPVLRIGYDLGLQTQNTQTWIV